MTDIEIDLPFPPSTNELWRSSRGRVHRSDAYKSWQLAADASTMAQRGWRNKKIEGRYTVLLILNESMMNAAADGDNHLKAPLDYAAKRLGLVTDDSIKYARQWTIKLGDDTNSPTGCRLILRSLD